MGEWKKHKFSEVFTSSSGLSKNREEFGFGFPFLTFKDVFNNYFLPDKLENLANTSEKERVSCSVKKGDLFLTRTSETQNELGMSSVALKNYEEATFNGFTKRLRIRNEYIDTIDFIYLGYYMRSPKMRNQISSLSIMTTRASLNNSMIGTLDLELPNITIQKKIGEILFALDRKIENNRRICEKLEEMAQAIFKRWFVEFNFLDENGEPYKDNGGEMVGSELGLIPKGWEVGTLDDVGTIVGGSTPSKKREDFYEEGAISWITPRDLSGYDGLFIDKGELSITQEGYDSCSTKILEKGSILFTSRAPIGYIAIASNEVCTNQGFKSIVPDKGYGTEYLFEMIKQITPTIINAGSGSTFKEISGAGMKNISIVLPPKGVANIFRDCTNSFFETVKTKETENIKLRKVRDALLPKLMSGELEV